jgi:hypothetical protein
MTRFYRSVSSSTRRSNAPGRSPSRRRSSPLSSGFSSRLALETLEQRAMLSIVPGTWTNLNLPIPDANGAQVMELLTDGSVLAQGGSNHSSKDWYRLAPDSTGSYINGTWTQEASMGTERLFFPAAVLPSGKLMVLGGEFTGPTNTKTNINTAEIYDPIANSWAPLASFPLSNFGDDPLETLPDGRIIAGNIADKQTFIYDPTSNSWSQASSKLRNDRSDEESWVKLPDGSILSYDIFASESSGVGHAQRYIPATNSWTDAGTLPFLLSSAPPAPTAQVPNPEGLQQDELGPAVLLPDGRAFFLGANGNTAYYTPSTNSWTAGPVMPTDPIAGKLGAGDSPAAMLPNGDVLIAASPVIVPNPFGDVPNHADPNFHVFSPPTKIFEFNPTTGTYLDVTPSNLNLNGQHSFTANMLVLPTGQVLLSNQTQTLDVYTPSGSPNPAWQPNILSFKNDGSGGTLMTGTQLNGISEGASYGDDNEMSTNYPIVRLRDLSNHISYGRTFNFGTGVATGATIVSTQFTVPAPGTYHVSSVANGIPSAEISLTFPVSPVIQINGDPNQSDIIRLALDPADKSLLDVFLNGSATPSQVNSLTGVTQINVDAGGGNDQVIFDSSNGLITVPIHVDGGSGADRIVFQQTGGPAISADQLAPGAASGAGRSIVTGVGGTQTVDFENFEPVVDTLPAPNFDIATVPGLASLLDASNAINYTPSQLIPSGGRVTVDSFEPIEFSAKVSLTISAGAGSDTINLNNPTTPTGLTSITVDGADPTASDTLIVNGTSGADTITYEPGTTAGAGTISVNAQPPISMLHSEHLIINGQGGGDTLKVDTENINGTQVLTPGSSFDSGTLDFQTNSLGGGFIATSLQFLGLGNGASLSLLDY